MSNLPSWSLSEIYPGPDSNEFKADLKRIHEIKDIVLSSLDSLSIKELLDLFNEAGDLLSNVTSYSYALLSTDTSNSSYLKAEGDAEDASIAYSTAYKSFVRWAKDRKDEIKKFKDPDYSLFFSELEEDAKHLMSDAEESLADEFLKVSSSSWSRLQEAVTSSASDNGKTVIELRALASSPDREIRKDAYYREKKILKEHETALAYSLNGVKGTTLLLEKRRGWKNPIDRSLFSSRLSRKALDALIIAIEEYIPVFRGYMMTKAKLLGLEKLSWYDLFAPVGSNTKRYEFEDAKKIIIDSYSSFSEEMGAFAKKAFDQNWIDSEPHKGKVGGAYDTAFKKSGVSRVLLNYDYTYESVSTLAHELGHAYHDSVVMPLPSILSEYPMSLAESASIFGETVVFTEVLKTLKKEEQLPIIEQFVQSANQTCLDILSRYYFERDLFEKRRDGELSAAELSNLMLSAQERTYGDALDEKHEYMWAVKSHYYSESFSFYNYPYAFGQLFALSLFSKRNESPDFFSHYKALLRESGKKSAHDVALMAGCDIESVDFYLSGLSVIERYAKELESWL